MHYEDGGSDDCGTSTYVREGCGKTTCLIRATARYGTVNCEDSLLDSQLGESMTTGESVNEEQLVKVEP